MEKGDGDEGMILKRIGIFVVFFVVFCIPFAAAFYFFDWWGALGISGILAAWFAIFYSDDDVEFVYKDFQKKNEKRV